MIGPYAKNVRDMFHCTVDEANRIVDIMGNHVVHSTLDWLSDAEFATAARKAHRLYARDKAAFDEYYDAVQAAFCAGRQAAEA